MKKLLLIGWLGASSLVIGQEHRSLKSYQPEEEFENIHVLKIADDSLQSSYIIWVKKGVKGHFHQTHTENLVVIEGKATMRVGDKTITIKKGDFLNIPNQTPHSVLEVKSRKPLKVLSIQSPQFQGKDRIFINK